MYFLADVQRKYEVKIWSDLPTYKHTRSDARYFKVTETIKDKLNYFSLSLSKFIFHEEFWHKDI